MSSADFGSVSTLVFPILKGIQNMRYALVAVYCFLIYDWLLSLEREIRLIHKARWTSIKTLYILCRYYGIIVWPVFIWAYVQNHGGGLCQRVAYPVHWLFAFPQIFSQAVIAIRAYAFAGATRMAYLVLGSSYLLGVAVALWAFFRPVAPISVLFYDFVGPNGCFPDINNSDDIVLRIGLSVCAHTLTDLVALGRCYRLQQGRGYLARYFVRQGLLAFGLMASTNGVAAALYYGSPAMKSATGIPFIISISCVIACRLFDPSVARESDLDRLADISVEFNND
ncbi:hypothetical protein BDQ12DRAFT_721902 [Crucibulum laeve]|uniref:DUF6533 domain-containing protein n=1 Tax=Crucibulum laeve TaxID=68775 RepID=A0A5C3M4Y5_9AGAR|nr:hypothetical protein BDQ12DRAFT_721902 [Crucibulum laeve]